MAVKKKEQPAPEPVVETVVATTESVPETTTEPVVAQTVVATPEQSAATPPVPVHEAVSLIAKTSEGFARGTASLLKAVERLNTICNSLEAKVISPELPSMDGFVKREELAVAVGKGIESLKVELVDFGNRLATAICEANGCEWGQEEAKYFFGPNSTETEKADIQEIMEALP